MTNATHTSVRFSPRTREKIEELMAAGHSQTIAGILETAVDRMYQEEIRGYRQPDEKPEKKKPKAWGVVYED